MPKFWKKENNMKMKKINFKKYNLVISIILVVGILIMVNFFSYHLFYRWDLTANQNYSISNTSKQVVRNLPDVVQVKLYFSKDLPNNYKLLRQNILDILHEYASYSNNFRIEIVDNIKDVDAYRLGIPKLQFNVLKKDQFQIVNGYLGMSIEYYDRQEVIPIVQAENFEYQLTSIIKKLTSEDLPVIGFVSSNQTVNINENINTVQDALSKIYRLESVDLSTDEAIDSKIKTLIILNPLADFSEAEMRKLDNFLMQGKALFIAQDREIVNNLQTTENKSNLNNFLSKYGLKIDNNLILDQSSAMASFRQGPVTFNVNYPFWVKIINKDFAQDNPAVSKLDNLVLPWASSVEYSAKADNQAKINTQVMYLAKTTQHAWSMTNNFNLRPGQSLTQGTPQQHNLVVGLVGLHSAYDDAVNKNARIIVMGDSEFIFDNFLKSYPYNKVFFLNLVDYLSLDQDLIKIRSKKIVVHPLKTLPDYQKKIIKYGNVFGLTVLIIIFGLVRYYLRKKSNNVKL